jgi:hypothetical protein
VIRFGADSCPGIDEAPSFGASWVRLSRRSD